MSRTSKFCDWINENDNGPPGDDDNMSQYQVIIMQHTISNQPKQLKHGCFIIFPEIPTKNFESMCVRLAMMCRVAMPSKHRPVTMRTASSRHIPYYHLRSSMLHAPMLCHKNRFARRIGQGQLE